MTLLLFKMAFVHVDINLFSVWLKRKHLASYICFCIQSFAMSHIMENSTVNCETMRVTMDINVLVLL